MTAHPEEPSEPPAETVPPPAQDPPSSHPKDEEGLAVVGIGASAGGIEALLDLFRYLPPRTGLAFIVLLHQAAGHRSLLAQVLGRATEMEVVEARHGMVLEADRVHCVPAESTPVLSGERIRLKPRRDATEYRVDEFFRSLAESHRERALGVLLSGTGTDGTEGLRRIKEEGGITLVQSPETAAYPGMPGSAVATGQVDYVLPTPALAETLARLAQHPFLAPGTRQAPDSDETAFASILRILESATGVDFTYYKANTLRRRIRRRMLMRQVESVGDYARSLEDSPPEIEELYGDLLIQVTSMFRDPDLFRTLRKTVVPELVDLPAPGEPIRIWVPGCATGEEAYSLAICLEEEQRKRASRHPVQVFATDISDKAIQRARLGRFPPSVDRAVPRDLLERYFQRTERGFALDKEIRSQCVFARQDVTRDPPFSHVHLVSCRNLLIYLAPPQHQRLLRIFHGALVPRGFLILGESETVGRSAHLFSMVDRKHKIYSRKAVPTPPVPPAAPGARNAMEVVRITRSEHRADEVRWSTQEVLREADRVTLARFGPPGAIVNEDLEVVQIRGRIGRYLEPAPGAATHNILKMARKGLLIHLRAALKQARQHEGPVRKQGVQVTTNGGAAPVDLEVLPIRLEPAQERYYLVLFDESRYHQAKEEAEGVPEEGPRDEPAAAAEILLLQQELSATREYLHSIIEEREAANEELTAASEEIQSANEELQSTNEELETAKEELQATNEELTTVNEELHERNLELTRANNDLRNLLATFSIPVLILGPDLTIRRFTPMAERLMNLIPGDVGRPIRQIRPNLDVHDLEERVLEVIDTLVPAELEARDRDGHWWLVRIRPYRTSDNLIDGAILVFLDIDQLRHALDESREVHDLGRAVLDAVREPVVLLDADLRVERANPAFYEIFRLEAAEVEGRSVFSLAGGAWDIPGLHALLEDNLEKTPRCDDFPVHHDFPGLGPRSLLFNARRIEARKRRIVLSIEERID